ncbi:MAG: hypothetical protein IT374_12480 [Polyangiaceae bacterium]|nr:hypothetical protein [Polyangiaceae bacterium]
MLPGIDGAVGADQDDSVDQEPNLVALAVSGRTPPAGPTWQPGLAQLVGKPFTLDQHPCASMDGCTLHAAARACALDTQGREALLRYALRPAIAQERVERRFGGLVRVPRERASWRWDRRGRHAPAAARRAPRRRRGSTP